MLKNEADYWLRQWEIERALNAEILHVLIAFREILTDDIRESLNKRKSDSILKAMVQRIDEVYANYSKIRGK